MLTAALRERADALRAARTPYVEATVVHAQRPTSARPGDTALVLPDGTLLGFVGGTCAESTVRAHAVEALAQRRSLLLRIVPDAGPATGDDRGVVIAHNPCESGGTLEVFLAPQLPPPLVVVYGDQPVARALVAVTDAVGWAATLAAADAPVPPDADAVVLALHGRGEHAALRAALDAGTAYIGLVASPRRGTAVLDALGLTAAESRRVHTPAGLDLGARTPAEIALSVLAEILALRPRPQAGPAPEPPRAPSAATAVDPICGMTVVAAPPTLVLDVGGSPVWFCGPGCRDAFAARTP